MNIKLLFIPLLLFSSQLYAETISAFSTLPAMKPKTFFMPRQPLFSRTN